MTMAPQVFGPALIKLGTDSLGYTRNGADIRGKAFFQDVPGDENGGEQGPAIEIQYLGETSVIRLELTKYDPAIATKALARLKGGTEGTPGAPGTLMFGGDKTSSLTISPTSGQAVVFDRVLLRGDWEINRGTRYSTLVLEFEAHKDADGKLYEYVTVSGT